VDMTRRMALICLAGLDLPRGGAERLSASYGVAFHYGAVFDPSAVEWYTRFAILVTGGFLSREESRKLMAGGSKLVAYEWSSAFYPADRVSADLAWQAEALKHKSKWLLNSQPVGGGAAMPDRDAFWYDFADPELRSARAAHLAARVSASGYSGLFLDTLGFEQVPPVLQREFSARHPGADYNREQAGFLETLRTAAGSDKILFLNQGYRHAELFLPHADFDLTESYFVGSSAGETQFRPWDDPADRWHSILEPMEQLVVPASQRFPSVKFVHLGYAAGPEERTRRAIVYNYAAAKLWDHGAYLVAQSPAAEQDKAYFSDLGRPLAATYAHDPGRGVAWREFEGGVVALNTGSRTTSILDGRYQLLDPPRGYVFRQ
jgi:hypothetical protein